MSTEFQKLVDGLIETGHLLYTMGICKNVVCPRFLKITAEIGVDAGEILLLSDSVGELDATREAGMQTTRLVRNEQDTDGSRHTVCDDFSGVCI